MFNTKLDVDKHVEACLKKIINEKERNSRGYTFAKLYYNVGAYEEAIRHVTNYLSVKSKSPEGHYLLGLAFEKLGKKDLALESYRTSLQQDPKQNNLLLKVCELLARDDLDVDLSEAKQYCQMAENFDPHNPSLFSLREKLILKEDTNPEDVIKLLLKELESRPTDVNLRVRLLRNFIQNNKINEAYKHVYDIEVKNLLVFSSSLLWYEVITDVLLRYKRQSQQQNLTWSFWCLFISVLDKILALKLDERNDRARDNSEYINQLFIFDQALLEASHNIGDCPDRQISSEFINHYKGQLYFHFATTIFKQAKKDLIPFKEANSITLPLLFVSFNLKPVDLQAMWINHLQESQQRFIKRWHQEGAHRCSQAGHILIAAAKDKKTMIVSKATQYSSGMWQENIFKKIFIVREQQLKMVSSYLFSNHVDINFHVPSNHEVSPFDEESFNIFPDSLHHFIWVSLNNDLKELKYSPFQGLQYSIKNLQNCGAETLSLLDIQSFIYCATICAKNNLENLKQMLYYNTDKPSVLPEAVTGQLGTVEQAKFLIAAYKMYRNELGSDSGEMRLILIRGIEAVRCIGRHGLDVSLLVKLADIFAAKAKRTDKKSEVEFCDARAELYWGAALPLLGKLKNNQSVIYSSNKMFDFKTKELSLFQVCDFIERGKLYLGTLAMKRNEYEKALNKFQELKDPYASFHQAQIYKKMADNQMNQNKESVTSEMRSQNVILLSKARDCLYLTLERLREPTIDKNHPLNAQLSTEIEKMERLLSRIDPDCANRNECDGMSDENTSSADSTEHYTSANYNTQQSIMYSSPLFMKNDTKNQSTPLRLNITRREPKPSPERLDAQLRQLMATKDVTMNAILDQNRVMLESHRNLVDELRLCKEAVYNLSGQVENLKNVKSGSDEIKDLKKSVDELKSSVDELQSFKTVTDMVYELKRELMDIKKNNAKSQPADDLYILDDEYPEYNIGGNTNMNTNSFHNFSSRFPPPVPPAALYPHGLYPNFYGSIPPYGYPNLGLPPQAALSYGADQLPPDLRGLANPGIQPNPLYPPQPSVIQPPLNLGANSANNSLLIRQSLSQIDSQMNILNTPKISTSVPTIVNSTTTLGTLTSTVTTSKSAPVNVVITSSDPLPTLQSSTSQPVLSVTIPPQHIKGGVQKNQPHNYQISLPTSVVTTPPSLLAKPAPPVATEEVFSNTASSVYSAVSDKNSPSKNLGLQIEKSLEQTFFSPSASELGQAPQPFVGTTDIIIFVCPGKLYEFNNDSKEFKEKGSGLCRLIEDKTKNSVRILMKQDLGKVIANHYVTKDLNMASTKENAYYWSALDYSERQPAVQKFCLKLKNAEDAKKFYEAFEIAKKKLTGAASSNQTDNKSTSVGGNTFGGFLFTSSPIFKPTEVEPSQIKATPSVENKAQSPFANFSFGASNKSVSVLEMNKTTPSLLSSMSATPSKIEAPKSPDVSKQCDSSIVEDFVPTAEFQPVIPLPDMVEVRTGEEDSVTLLDCRAKLLRFDSDKKEWKERGLGNIKILKEKTLIRLLMRREQVHKVCCNHQLLKDMNFQYMPNNLKALTWCAQDFADEVLKTETFAIRFKTEEQASDFLKCILSAQGSLNDDNLLKNVKPSGNISNVNIAEKKGFDDKFKPAKGSWECKSCYINNEATASKCIACETPSPLNKPAKTTESDTKPPKTTTTDAKPSKTTTTGWGDAFKPKEGTWECKCCFVRNERDVLYCVSCESPRDETVPKKSSNLTQGVNLDTPFKFNFGIGTATTKASTEQTPPAFKFGSSTAFGFGDSVSRTSNSDQSVAVPKTTDSFVFGSPVAHEFEFKPRSPRKSTGPGDEESDCSYVEEEADNIYFKPLIPLPDKVEVKTGEEDEEIMYCHRAKLFRFVGSEWKERGIGDVKILRNRSSNKSRVLMRREQVLKICLNHALTPNIEYLPKDDKTWLFVAADFSEGEVSHDQFCIRFKTSEIAQDFKDAVAKTLNGNSSSVKIEEIETDSDVEFVSETMVNSEDIQEAQRLRLPSKYLAYKQRPLCDCRQCILDEEYFKGTILDENRQGKGPFSTPKGNTSDSSGSPYLTPSAASFGVPSKHDTLKDILSKPSVIKTPTAALSSENVFSPPVSSTTTTAGNLFGSKFGSGNNVFGSKPSDDKVNSSRLFSFAPRISTDLASPAPSNILSSAVNIAKSSENKMNSFTVSTDSKNIFCTPKEALFGKPSNLSDAGNNSTTSTIFSTPTQKTDLFGSVTPGIFGSNSSTTGNIFGPKNTPTTSVTIFGSNNSTTGSIFGSNNTPTTSVNIFGSSNSTTGSIFGSNTPTTSVSIFGSTTTTTGSIFGSNTTPGSVFGSNNPITGSIFGPNSSTTTATIFGGSTTVTTSSGIFSSTSTPTVDIFGAAKPSTTTAAASSIFGSVTSSTASPFGSLKTGSLFGNSNVSLFGSGTKFDFGKGQYETSSQKNDIVAQGNETVKTSDLKEDDEVVLKCKSDVSFSTLAQQNQNVSTAFQNTADGGDKTQTFAFLGAGAPVFGGKKKQNKEDGNNSLNNSKQGEEENEENNDPDDGYDPHYDPIIPMPDAIVVNTGEEEETVLFNERAKLFRYDADTKEWKERGVGQMKILLHPQNGTYRFLLRREQVHKAVLNQLITPTLDLQPMTTSDKAWVWAGHNYVEDETKLEKLAIRFKYSEIAQTFFESVQDCIKTMREVQSGNTNLPETIQNYGVENVSSDSDVEDENCQYNENDYDEDDPYDDDYEGERTIMFSKMCTLHELTTEEQWAEVCSGEIQIYYDSEIYGSKISFVDEDGTLISNSVIGINTVMTLDDNQCTWKTVELACEEINWRNLRAVFDSEQSAKQFFEIYLEGLSYAQEWEILDDIPGVEIEEIE